jgi:outer membrane lipoprotein-sorting protein
MKRTTLLGSSTALVLVVTAVAISIARAQQALTAEQILVQMTKVYKECKTYKDTGTTKWTSVMGDFNRLYDGEFTTAFSRPDRFRFEFKGNASTQLKNGESKQWGIHYIAWHKKPETHYFSKVLTPRIEKSESLSVAVAGGTGISGGSATIPAFLLLPEEFEGNVTITGMTKVTRIEDAVFDGTDCYSIKGDWVGRATKVWIEKKTFLLRKIHWIDSAFGMTMESTTTWEPFINEEVPRDLLEFNAPQIK